MLNCSSHKTQVHVGQDGIETRARGNEIRTRGLEVGTRAKFPSTNREKRQFNLCSKIYCPATGLPSRKTPE